MHYSGKVWALEFRYTLCTVYADEMARRWILVAALLAIGGCKPQVVVNGFKIREDIWIKQSNKVMTMARRDLRCPAPNLIELTLLTMARSRPKKVGAIGCGMQVRYKYGRYLAYWRQDSAPKPMTR